jgi:integrase
MFLGAWLMKVCFCYVTDIVTAGLGIWGSEGFGALQDPKLKLLASELPAILRGKWSDATSKSYTYAFKKWEAWTGLYSEITALPANPGYVCLYITKLSQEGASIATINNCIASINWAHQLAGLDSPTSNIVVRNTVAGLKRKLSKPRKVAMPITTEHLRKMVACSDLKDLSDLRALAIILLSFSGLLRFAEVSSVRTEHIIVKQSHLELVLPKAKNDQFRQGQTVYIAKLDSVTCPVNMLLSYLSKASIDLSIPGYVFKNVRYAKGSLVVKDLDVAMKYSRVSEIVQSMYQKIGLSKKLFKLHSLRAGGATAAANNHVSDRQLQRHGRWRSGEVKNRYITESISDLLSVTHTLGM